MGRPTLDKLVPTPDPFIARAGSPYRFQGIIRTIFIFFSSNSFPLTSPAVDILLLCYVPRTIGFFRRSHVAKLHNTPRWITGGPTLHRRVPSRKHRLSRSPFACLNGQFSLCPATPVLPYHDRQIFRFTRIAKTKSTRSRAPVDCFVWRLKRTVVRFEHNASRTGRALQDARMGLEAGKQTQTSECSGIYGFL